jgi:hypothetical protein
VIALRGHRGRLGADGNLLGGLPVGAMVLGTGLGALYLAFAVAVVAAISGLLRSVPAIALSERSVC